MFFRFPDLAQLESQVKGMASNYYSANSRSTRAMQVRKYLHFIEEFRGLISPLPCPSSQVAIYIVWLARSLKYSSITNYLSALNFFIKSEGFPPIDFSDHLVRTVLGGAKRTLGCVVKRAAPLLPAELLKIFNLMSEREGHVCARAAILTGFRALLRKCQITDSDSVLRRTDFQFFQWGMLITVRRSKTIQFSERELLIPVARVANKTLCAVHWVEKHFAMSRVSPNSPAFQMPTVGGGVLNPSTIRHSM